MATKYLKHLNHFPATYLRDFAGTPPIEVKPGEMLLYTDIINSDINNANYNLNLWTDYIEKNNFAIVTIQDPAPPTPVTTVTPTPNNKPNLLVSGNYSLALYDNSGNRLVQFVGTSLRVTDGDFTTATVRYVNGMFKDVDGVVYFIDRGYHTYDGTLIRKIEFTGIDTGTITTIAATTPADYDASLDLIEFGIVVDANYIYTADDQHQVIWRTPKTGGQRVLFADLKPFTDFGACVPSGLAILPSTDGSSNLFVADNYGYVLSVNSHGVCTPLVRDNTNFSNIFSITTDGTYLYSYTGNPDNWGLAKITTDGTVTFIVPQGDGPIPSNNSYDCQILSYSNNIIYVAASNTNFAINAYDTTGTLQKTIVLSIPASNPASAWSPHNILAL